jgi:hypothetical protein
MPHGPYAQASFEDQFEDVSGQNLVEIFTFEVPFDLVLTRASVGTVLATAVAEDAYIVISKRPGPQSIVDAGPVPPNRNLPVKTDFIKGIDLPSIPCFKGDLIDVCLFLVTNNTVHRAKVVLSYCCLLQKIGLPPDYGYGYSGPHP